MGAETSTFKDCKHGEPHEVVGEKQWSLHPSKSGDGSSVSIFLYKSGAQKDLIENSAKVNSLCCCGA